MNQNNALEDYLINLQKMGVRHTLKSCSSSTSIKIDGGRNYFFPNGDKIDPKYLKFITDTKAEVCANAAELNFKEQTPKFIKFSPMFNDNFFYTDFVEIDITSAYWFTAYDFRLITKTTYENGLQVPKKVRLMALGSAAATKDVMYFDGKEYEHQGIEYDPHGRNAFFEIAKKVDDVMCYCLDLLHGSAAFYWVDALFIKKPFQDYATELIKDFGYEVKQIPLLWLRGDNQKGNITAMRILDSKNGIDCLEKKTYHKPQKKRKNAKSI